MVWHFHLTFNPQGAFCACVVFPLSQKGVERRGDLLIFYSSRISSLFVLAMTIKVFIRDKHWLFTLFLLLLPFQRANRKLIVNASTGATYLLSQEMKNRLVVNV